MESCGNELAADAVVPERLASLMRHVAENMDAHARWVGSETLEARAEHAGLSLVAEAYRGIAGAAEQAAAMMHQLRDLKPAPHDPAGWDPAAFRLWMREKIELQRAFAALLLEHADASEQVLAGND